MARLVDADAYTNFAFGCISDALEFADACDAINSLSMSANRFSEWNSMGVLFLIDRQPTVNAVPVVHGEWIMNSNKPDTMTCSICNIGFDIWKHESKDFKFCPNCGARMDLEVQP